MNGPTFRLRGVTYTAQPQADGTVALWADDTLVGTATIGVRLHSTVLLGGDEASAAEIYAGLEEAFGTMLAIGAAARGGVS